MEKLKSCPICGGVEQMVGCSNCGLIIFGVTKEEAVAKWNNRPSPWHTGTPTEEGDYLVAFRMSDNSVEYGWCNWNNGAWDILCDYDTTDGSCGMIAWQKIEPCNWFDFLFSEGYCDNWREVR